MTKHAIGKARRPRVLVINEYADPETVSMALVSFSHARALSRVADVFQITHARHREAFVRAGLHEGVDFEAIDLARVERPFEVARRMLGKLGRVGWSTVTALHIGPYQWFEHQVWRRHRAQLEAREFDLVHRLSPISPSYPSPLAAKCARIGVPFVIGPLNGGLPWPKGYGGVRLRESELLGYLRAGLKWVPGYRSTRANASALLVGSAAMRNQIEPRWQEKTVYLPENGIDPSRFTRPVEGSVELPLRVAFAGRMVALKCVDVLIEAAAPLVRAGQLRLELFGDGPERPSLEALAAREEISAGVEFAGWIEHGALEERLRRSRVFAFPSVRDFGGGAVLEAMALGLVPVVVGYGGPAELVTPSTGRIVPLADRARLVAGFRSVLERLAADPAAVEELGRRARARALGKFTWEAKAEQTLEVYRWVLGERKRPDFGMPFSDGDDLLVPAPPG